jgi:glycosyltransferase involved in cell wall biosynthesis
MLSVVLCAHNEASSLPTLLPHLLRVLDRSDVPFEVLVVNDASDDDTGAIVDAFAKTRREIQLISLPVRSGQTGCFREAFKVARGEWLIRMDADLQDDPDDLPLFIDRLKNGADLVMGLRECRKHGRMLRIAGGIYDLIILCLFDTPLHSNTGSFVGFRTQWIRDIPFRRNDHRYIPLMVIRRGAKRMAEVIVRHHPRAFGTSHYNALKKLILGIPEVLLFLYRLHRGTYDLAACTSNRPPVATEPS